MVNVVAIQPQLSEVSVSELRSSHEERSSYFDSTSVLAVTLLQEIHEFARVDISTIDDLKGRRAHWQIQKWTNWQRQNLIGSG